ncbi:MAG: hypothetical protein ACRC92_11365 [Peptostreptococcaceae bacterium]
MYLQSINDSNKAITKYVTSHDSFYSNLRSAILNIEMEVMCSERNGVIVGDKLKTMGDIFINRTYNLKFIKLREELTELNNALLETISKVDHNGTLMCKKDVMKNITEEIVDVLVVSAHILYLFKEQHLPARIDQSDVSLFLNSLVDIIIKSLVDNECTLFDSLGALPHALKRSYNNGILELITRLEKFSDCAIDGYTSLTALQNKVWSKIEEYDNK